MFPVSGRALARQALSAVAFLALTAQAFCAATPAPAQTNVVHGEGCVQAGVEAHCLVLRDLKTGHSYDLLFKAERPPVGMGIEFTGVLHPGPTACMQGAAVDVTQWTHKASIKCSPGQAGKSSKPAAH